MYNPNIWIGVVENNVDNQKRGRVQVRIFGVHDVYNPPKTDADGRTAWGNLYAPETAVSTSGVIPRFASNRGTISGIPTKANGSLEPWQRYNNPMNLKDYRHTNGNEYIRYNDISLAYVGYYKQLQRYYSGRTTGVPLRTPAQICSTWAPKSDGNATEEYIQTVSKLSGLKANQPIDINNLDQVAALFSAMTIRECSQRFSISSIKDAIQGKIIPEMTHLSTLLKDGKLYLGSSNAVEAGDSSTSGVIPHKPSGNSELLNDNTEKAKASAKANSDADEKLAADYAKKKAAATEQAKEQAKADASAATETGKKAQEAKPTPTQIPQSSGTATAETSGPDNTGHSLPTEDLPWAFVLYPASDYGGTSFSTLPAPQVQVGAWVFGVSLDGDFYNQLFILGIIPNNINIDVLSTNPNETGTPTITGSTDGSGSLGGYSARQMPSVAGVNTGSKISFDMLQDGIWYAGTDRSKNKTPTSPGEYGAMQIPAALAAKYLLLGAGSGDFSSAGWNMDESTKAMLTKLASGNGGSGYWENDVTELCNSDSKVKDFCDLLQSNDALNMAIGTAYLRDCCGSSQGNGDPLMAALYYKQGAPNAQKILAACGYKANEYPSGVSHEEFARKVNQYIKETQHTDFEAYANKVFESVGGIAGLD